MLRGFKTLPAGHLQSCGWNLKFKGSLGNSQLPSPSLNRKNWWGGGGTEATYTRGLSRNNIIFSRGRDGRKGTLSGCV